MVVCPSSSIEKIKTCLRSPSRSPDGLTHNCIHNNVNANSKIVTRNIFVSPTKCFAFLCL
eukprot:m.8831 g.8831  ORF g.8831 m.8831 type:complete len:60 (+) comp7207_c0_seq1:18-197(+)